MVFRRCAHGERRFRIDPLLTEVIISCLMSRVGERSRRLLERCHFGNYHLQIYVVESGIDILGSSQPSLHYTQSFQLTCNLRWTSKCPTAVTVKMPYCSDRRVECLVRFASIATNVYLVCIPSAFPTQRQRGRDTTAITRYAPVKREGENDKGRGSRTILTIYDIQTGPLAACSANFALKFFQQENEKMEFLQPE